MRRACGSLAVGAGRAEASRGEESGDAVGAAKVGEEAKHGRRPVALAVPAAEAAVGHEARPALAGERRAEEARGFVGRDAEEDVLDDPDREVRNATEIAMEGAATAYRDRRGRGNRFKGGGFGKNLPTDGG